MRGIKVSKVTKSFGKKSILENVSTFFKPCTIYGLLGRNGVGKSTTLKVLSGMIQPQSGSVVIDDGARAALHSRGGSLLPVGVTRVNGTFSRGDVIAVKDEDGVLIARGITSYSSQEAELTRGMKLDMVGRVVPALAGVALIHRDELLVF